MLGIHTIIGLVGSEGPKGNGGVIMCNIHAQCPGKQDNLSMHDWLCIILILGESYNFISAICQFPLKNIVFPASTLKDLVFHTERGALSQPNPLPLIDIRFYSSKAKTSWTIKPNRLVSTEHARWNLIGLFQGVFHFGMLWRIARRNKLAECFPLLCFCVLCIFLWICWIFAV